MANAEAAKDKPGISFLPNIKYEVYEPTDQSEEPGQLRIINFFSISQTEHFTKSHEILDVISRPSRKNIKRRSLPEVTIDESSEVATTRRRCSFRTRSFQTSHVNSDERNHFPSPVYKSKEKSKSINEEEILSCDICSIVFFSVDSLEEHVVDMHVVDKEFNCTECSKSFINQERLDSHLTEHLEAKKTQTCNTCPICFKIFTSKRASNLKKHMMTHDVVKPIKCELCSKSFVQRSDLFLHEVSHHGKPKIFQCTMCPKSFPRKCSLHDHLRKHSNVKTMVCPGCSSTFKTKYSLALHRTYCKFEVASKSQLWSNHAEGDNIEELKAVEYNAPQKLTTRKSILWSRDSNAAI